MAHKYIHRNVFEVPHSMLFTHAYSFHKQNSMVREGSPVGLIHWQSRPKRKTKPKIGLEIKKQLSWQKFSWEINIIIGWTRNGISATFTWGSRRFVDTCFHTFLLSPCMAFKEKKNQCKLNVKMHLWNIKIIAIWSANCIGTAERYFV